MAWLLVRGDAGRIPLPDRSVDLVMGSPPYGDARTYGIGADRKARDWVEWMLGITAEALRVSRGAVVWVVGGWTRQGCYQPGCEGLLWEWWARGLGECWRPVYWHRPGIPGSGGKQWFRADIEYCFCFKRPGPCRGRTTRPAGTGLPFVRAEKRYRVAKPGAASVPWIGGIVGTIWSPIPATSFRPETAAEI